jgi:hypothetical protein
LPTTRSVSWGRSPPPTPPLPAAAADSPAVYRKNTAARVLRRPRMPHVPEVHLAAPRAVPLPQEQPRLARAWQVRVSAGAAIKKSTLVKAKMCHIIM